MRRLPSLTLAPSGLHITPGITIGAREYSVRTILFPGLIERRGAVFKSYLFGLNHSRSLSLIAPNFKILNTCKRLLKGLTFICSFHFNNNS